MIVIGKPMASPIVPWFDKAALFSVILMGPVTAVKLKSVKVLKTAPILAGNI
jgi:hypothetical protein